MFSNRFIYVWLLLGSTSIFAMDQQIAVLSPKINWESTVDKNWLKMVDHAPLKVQSQIESNLFELHKKEAQVRGLQNVVRRSNGSLVVTPQAYNAIVNIPKSMRQEVDGVCTVNAGFTTKAERVIRTVSLSTLLGAAGGAIIGGFKGGYDNANQEYRNQQKLAYQSAYAQTFNKEYPKEHEKIVWHKIAENGCLADVYANKIIDLQDRDFNPVDIHIAQNDSFENRMGYQIAQEGKNPFSAFHIAAKQECFSRYEKEAQEQAAIHATQLAVAAGQEAYGMLPKSNCNSFSLEDAQTGALYGMGAGFLSGFGLSWWNGDFSRPIAQESIANMDKKI